MIVVWCDGTPIPTHQDSMSDLTSTGREREAEPEGDSNPSGDRPLTPRQQRFVDEYLIDSNGTQAAIRAGYSAHTAASQAERLLRNVEIVRAVSVGRAAIAERNKVKVDDIIAEYVRIAFSDPRNYDLDPDTGQLQTRDGADPSVWRAISSVKRKIRRTRTGTEIDVEFRLWDKLNALEKLGKHLGLFKDRPALEVLLALLPPELAGPLRDALARYVTEGGGQGGGRDG
jgi:phage terminase small subunit